MAGADSSLKQAPARRPWPKSPRGILRNVEIFDAGNHKGQEYTIEDLDDMVKNFKRFSGDGPGPRVNPPAVIGHEKDQEWLKKNTGVPAAGWPRKVWRKGMKLRADIGDLPKDVADAIANRHYKFVSAEIYETPPEGVPAKGKMLRRVSFLGGELPHLKTLKKLPHPEIEAFSESYEFTARPTTLRTLRTNRQGGVFQAFSEVSAMSRDEMIERLIKEKGVDRATAEGMDDKQLEAALATKEGGDGGGGEEHDTSWMDAAADGKEAMSKFKERVSKYIDCHSKKYKEKFGEDMPVDYVDTDGDGDNDAGDDGDDEAEVSDDDEMVSEDEDSGDLFEDDAEGGDDNADEGDEHTEYADGKKKGSIGTSQTIHQSGMEKKYFSEEQIKTIVADAVKEAVVSKFSEYGRADVRKELRDICKDGHIDPWQLEGPASLEEVAMKLDPARIIKFSENGKTVEVSERDAFLANLRRQPRRHVEQIQGHAAGVVATFSEADLEVERVQKFSETSEGRAMLSEADWTPIIDGLKVADKQGKANILASLRQGGVRL